MGVDSIEKLNKLQLALNSTIHDYLTRHLPLRRITLVAAIIKNCNIPSPHLNVLSDRIISEQKNDGGWIDCEDTAWSLSCISGQEKYAHEFAEGWSWLKDEQCKDNAWGFCARDNPCIPITAQILYFLSEYLSGNEEFRWLEKSWQKDLHSPVSLNYKAAWYLLAYCMLHHTVNASPTLFSQTIEYLIKEQRDNGSWGPWKIHPAPDDCFITGICMAGLATSYPLFSDSIIIHALSRAIEWIKQIQLENGLFPTHYIEEGSAWILFGWSKALAVLKSDGE